MYYQVDETGRILATTEHEEYAGDDYAQFDFPDDFDFSLQNEYRIVDGELVHDPEPPTDEMLQNEKSSQVADQIQLAVPMLIQARAITFTDEQAVTIPLLFADWTVGTDYKEDDIFRYHGTLYRVLQDTTALEQYTPDNAVSLYKRIGEPDENGIFPWSQPLGATDAYMIGEKVSHKNQIWESTCDNNVWEPGVYGWKIVEDEPIVSPDPEPAPEYDEWKQPSGSHDAYNKGDRVIYNGKVYESIMDGNVWSPDAYPQGWKEIFE